MVNNKHYIYSIVLCALWGQVTSYPVSLDELTINLNIQDIRSPGKELNADTDYEHYKSDNEFYGPSSKYYGLHYKQHSSNYKDYAGSGGDDLDSEAPMNMTILCYFDDNELEGRSPVETGSRFKWKNLIIPFYFDENIQENDKLVFSGCMEKIQSKSSFKFEERESEPTEKHLQIIVGTEPCSSGFSGSVATISDTKMVLESKFRLTDQKNDCKWEGGILHELFHALGIGHTQRRKDRDRYIKLNEENIIPNALSQYRVCSNCQVFDNVPYECSSIMHYGTGTFSKDGKPTMTAMDPSNCLLTSSGPAFEGTMDATDTDWKLVTSIAAESCKGDK